VINIARTFKFIYFLLTQHRRAVRSLYNRLVEKFYYLSFCIFICVFRRFSTLDILSSLFDIGYFYYIELNFMRLPWLRPAMTLYRWSQVFIYKRAFLSLLPPSGRFALIRIGRKGGAGAVSARGDLKLSLHRHKVDEGQIPS